MIKIYPKYNSYLPKTAPKKASYSAPSFSGTSKPALFLASLAAIVSISAPLQGCSANNSPNSAVMDNIENSKIQIAQDFSKKLLDYGEKLDQQTLNQELELFFVQNDIPNITIENLESDLTTAEAIMTGNYDENHEFESGVLLLREMPDMKDEKARIRYVANVCHELVHALQFAKQVPEFHYSDEFSKDEQTELENMLISFYTQHIAHRQTTPIDFYLSNYQKHGLSQKDVWDIIDEYDKYKVSSFELKDKVDKEEITRAIEYMYGMKLNEAVDSMVDYWVNYFIDEDGFSPDKRELLKKTIVQKLTYQLQIEQEAYVATSNIIKSALGIKKSNINDIVCVMHEVLKDEFEKKLKTL